MHELQPLSAGHASSVLAFELANRAYFAEFISDRGDEYFADVDARYSALLRDQAAGVGAFYVLVFDDGTVIGRFNLIFEGSGSATLGYRVAERVAGQGVATATVRLLCDRAVTDHGVRLLRAATSHANRASQKVLLNAGLVPVGPAGPADLGGKQGTWFQRELAAGPVAAADDEAPGPDNVSHR